MANLTSPTGLLACHARLARSRPAGRPSRARPGKAGRTRITVAVMASMRIDLPCRTTVVWGDGYLRYDFGEHPMTPVRLDLTMRLARCLGVLDQLAVDAPVPAAEAELLTVHSADYLAAVRAASSDPDYLGHGLGSADNPVFEGMYDAAALIAGGSQLAARLVWQDRAEHAVNIAGGLHHAMTNSA